MGKKLTFLAVIVTLMTACSQIEEPQTNPKDDKSVINSELRSAAEAVQIAERVINNDKNATRSSLKVKASSVKPVIGASTRSISDTLLYAVDFENNQGFALVSANRNIEPILALTDCGSFDDPANKTNENYQCALNQVLAYSINPPTNTTPTRPLTPIPVPRDTTITETKNHPIIKIALNQKWPEGMYCPNYIAGCGPVAVAQILSAFERPNQISYTYSTRDKESESINWPLLKQHKKSDGSKSNAINGDYNNDQIVNHLNKCELNLGGHKTIGRLIRQIGELAYANYNSSSTGTTFSNLNYTINFLSGKSPLSYTSSPTSLFNTMLSDSKKLALITGFGYTTDNNDYVGHAWIADGTWQIKMVITEWVTLSTENEWETPKVDKFETVTSSDYFHFNWGWGGNCNGYFLSNIFDPNRGQSYDYTSDETNIIGVGNMNYNIYCAIYTTD